MAATPNAFDAGAVYLLARHRPARECTVEDYVAAMARQAELDAHAQTDLLGEVIAAVFDRLDLSAAARTTTNDLLKTELLGAAARWDARQTKMAAADHPRSSTTTNSYKWGAR